MQQVERPKPPVYHGAGGAPLPPVKRGERGHGLAVLARPGQEKQTHVAWQKARQKGEVGEDEGGGDPCPEKQGAAAPCPGHFFVSQDGPGRRRQGDPGKGREMEA
ncbi:MAG: hypothetical protein DRJ03_26790 [Chloroflexi bacterium]|nr:MAG: hypothetical protein DRJ03_26790 [Chloroflexota bacterium]